MKIVLEITQYDVWQKTVEVEAENVEQAVNQIKLEQDNNELALEMDAIKSSSDKDYKVVSSIPTIVETLQEERFNEAVQDLRIELREDGE